MKRNQTRWFELKGAELFYFASKGDPEEKARGVVALRDVTTLEGADDDTLQWTLSGRRLAHPYTLHASTLPDKRAWVQALRTAIRATKEKRSCKDATFALPADTFLVRCCTWNVAESVPSNFSASQLGDWLTGCNLTPDTPSWVEVDLNKPRVICVCLQEVDMSVSGVATDAIENLNLKRERDNDKAEQWRAAFLSAVTPLGYVESGYGHEASVFLQVFTQKDVTIKDAEVFMWRGRVLKGLVEAGNKGSISFRCSIDGVYYGFVGSHLAAHPEGNAKRNRMYHDTLQETEFATAPRRILEHDYVFWCGDLNYRLTGDEYETGTRSDAVLSALRKDIPSAIAKHDQLCLSRAGDGESGAFQVFHEAGITFFPSYKLFQKEMKDAVCSEQYNIKTETHHIPSYTDRILYYTRGCRPDALLRLWRPPPLVAHKLPQHPDRARPLGRIPDTAPHLPKEMGAVGVVCLDYYDTMVHTDHRQVYGLYVVTNPTAKG